MIHVTKKRIEVNLTSRVQKDQGPHREVQVQALHSPRSYLSEVFERCHSCQRTTQSTCVKSPGTLPLESEMFH